MCLKEDVNKCQKKITKTTVLNEIIADKKTKLHKEIGPLKKIQTGIKLKMKYSGSQIKKSEESLTYKLYQMEKNTSYLEDKVK